MQLVRLLQLLRAQGNSLTDLLLLAHLAEEGISGVTTQRAAAALRLSQAEILAAAHNLASVTLIYQTRETTRGRPLRHTITGKGLELLLSIYRPSHPTPAKPHDLLFPPAPARRSPPVLPPDRG